MRRTKEEIKDTQYYSTRKSLDSRIADYCYSREQVDTVLKICDYLMEVEKPEYDFNKAIDCNKPYDTAKAMQKKVDDLTKYFNDRGDLDNLNVISNIRIKKPQSMVKYHLDNCRKQIKSWLNNDGTFSDSQKKGLLSVIIIWLKETPHKDPFPNLKL